VKVKHAIKFAHSASQASVHLPQGAKGDMCRAVQDDVQFGRSVVAVVVVVVVVVAVAVAVAVVVLVVVVLVVVAVLVPEMKKLVFFSRTFLGLL